GSTAILGAGGNRRPRRDRSLRVRRRRYIRGVAGELACWWTVSRRGTVRTVRGRFRAGRGRSLSTSGDQETHENQDTDPHRANPPLPLPHAVAAAASREYGSLQGWRTSDSEMSGRERGPARSPLRLVIRC